MSGLTIKNIGLAIPWQRINSLNVSIPMHLKEKIKHLQDQQLTIDALLQSKDFSADFTDKDNLWILESLFDDGSCSVGFVNIDNKDIGPCKPHIHYDSKEYLICISGSFLLNINGNDVRTITEGECGVVIPGELHYSKPLHDNTKIVYVCVPADKDMSLLGKGQNGR